MWPTLDSVYKKVVGVLLAVITLGRWVGEGGEDAGLASASYGGIPFLSFPFRALFGIVGQSVGRVSIEGKNSHDNRSNVWIL